jgi:hypothetical protein
MSVCSEGNVGAGDCVSLYECVAQSTSCGNKKNFYWEHRYSNICKGEDCDCCYKDSVFVSCC